MGCCGRNNRKVKRKSEVIKVEKKKSLINDEINLIDQNQLLKNEPDIQQELILTPTIEETIQIKHRKKSPSISSLDYDIGDISSTDNISPIETLDDLQTFVQENNKSISIILFYGRYCPYSRRTIPDLRQWARANKDRIFLYEADVEQASKLAEYYHVQTIPTIMAFEDNNLLAPIWRRTAKNVLSSIEQSDEKIDFILDPSDEKINPNEIEDKNDISSSLTDEDTIDQCLF